MKPVFWHKWTPVSGPACIHFPTQNQCIFKPSGATPRRAQIKAEATWQWHNYVLTKVPAGVKALRINLDETAICLFLGGRLGNIFLTAGAPAVENVSLGRRRTYMTHIAVICDVPHIQRLLPQVLVCNERTVPAKDFAALRAAMPLNVLLIRQKSAWNNAKLMCETIRRIGKAVAPFRAEFRAVLSFDAAKIHIAGAVFSACRRAGLLPVLVAAKITYAIQPLDMRVFHPYKIVLCKEYQSYQLRSPGGVVSLREWLASVCEAIRVVMEGRNWARAFDSAGFGAGQLGISGSTTALLGYTAPVCVGAGRPSVDQLRACFPKRSKIPAKAIWNACDVPAVKAVGGLHSGVPLGPPMPAGAPPLPSSSLLARPPPPVSTVRRSGRIAAAAAKASLLAAVPPAKVHGAPRGYVALLGPPPPHASSSASSSHGPS